MRTPAITRRLKNVVLRQYGCIQRLWRTLSAIPRVICSLKIKASEAKPAQMRLRCARMEKSVKPERVTLNKIIIMIIYEVSLGVANGKICFSI